MEIIITGKNIELTEGLKDAVRTKLFKLNKYFNSEISCKVFLSVEKERQKVEITLSVAKTIIRAEQTSTDMYIAIDLASAVIEKQLLKYRNKLIDRKHSVASSFNTDIIANEDTEDVKIFKKKTYDTKPMYPEDACIQMELSGHDFFVFLNADTDKVNVVYKRKENTYGLIEPED